MVSELSYVARRESAALLQTHFAQPCPNRHTRLAMPQMTVEDATAAISAQVGRKTRFICVFSR